MDNVLGDLVAGQVKEDAALKDLDPEAAAALEAEVNSSTLSQSCPKLFMTHVLSNTHCTDLISSLFLC